LLTGLPDGMVLQGRLRDEPPGTTEQQRHRRAAGRLVPGTGPDQVVGAGAVICRHGDNL
jgi:hypothetical protein